LAQYYQKKVQRQTENQRNSALFQAWRLIEKGDCGFSGCCDIIAQLQACVARSVYTDDLAYDSHRFEREN
jgi:hypothetical protein